MMKRRLLNSVITGLIVVILAGAIYWLGRAGFHASSGTQVISAVIVIDVTEKGQSGLGLLGVTGDTSTSSIPSANGSFTVNLAKTIPLGSTSQLTLRTLDYQSFLSNQVYPLPISRGDTVDGAAIANGTTTHLEAAFDSTGLHLFEWTRVSAAGNGKLVEIT